MVVSQAARTHRVVALGYHQKRDQHGPRMPGHYQGVETTHTSNRTTAVRKHTANTLPRFDAARATHWPARARFPGRLLKSSPLFPTYRARMDSRRELARGGSTQDHQAVNLRRFPRATDPYPRRPGLLSRKRLLKFGGGISTSRCRSYEASELETVRTPPSSQPGCAGPGRAQRPCFATPCASALSRGGVGLARRR